jgi:hypothetical protein
MAGAYTGLLPGMKGQYRHWSVDSIEKCFILMGLRHKNLHFFSTSTGQTHKDGQENRQSFAKGKGHKNGFKMVRVSTEL